MWLVGYTIFENPWVVFGGKIRLCGYLFWLGLNSMDFGFNSCRFKSNSMCWGPFLLSFMDGAYYLFSYYVHKGEQYKKKLLTAQYDKNYII